MKFLWLAHRDPSNPRAGGAERTIKEVCERLVGYGNEVTLLTSNWPNALKIESLGGIKVHRYGRTSAVHFVVPLYLLKYNYDVVVVDLGHAIPWAFPIIFKKKSVVFFHHLHSRSLPGQINPLLALLISAIEKSYFLIYPHSRFVTESVSSIKDLTKLGIVSTNIVKIEPGVDKIRFRTGPKTKYPSIVYFAGMRKYKRGEECIILVKSLIKMFPTLEATFIGDGPERAKLESCTKKLGVTNHVNFTGKISDKNLAAAVAGAWLNIHTSVTEGWGFSILEASASGTPTVAYDVPGVRDAIENGLNGTKVRNEDRKALAEAAIKILKNPEPWWSSSPKVAEKYSWDVTAEKWEKLLKEVVAEKD